MISNQKGVGLIEVLIALMLLAIAVLGFSAMQLTALKATDESVMRSRAITIMRGAGEMMRANPSGICVFKLALNNDSIKFQDVNNNAQSLIVLNSSCDEYIAPATLPAGYQAPPTRTVSVKKTDCQKQTDGTIDSCTIEELAMQDALNLKKFATQNEIKMRLETCPATTSGLPLSCLIAAWGNTNATMGTADTDCINNTTGVYIKGSTCFVLEAY